MSLILDALKKLDREKSSRRNGTVNIAVDILRPDLPRPGKKMAFYFSAVSLTAVATAAITYVVMVEFGFLSKSSPPAPVNPPALNQQVAPAPFPSEPVRGARDEISRVPSKIQNPPESKAPVEARTPAEVKSSTESRGLATSVDEEKASQNAISEEGEATPGKIRKPAEAVRNGSATTPPSLKLSGIVWSEEPSKRLAVINGTITTEGSVIQGVMVVEIHPTHVILSYNGQPFEISMFK
jgi:general secretion pathway protein B